MYCLTAIMFTMDNLMKAMSQVDCVLHIGTGILDSVRVQVYLLRMTVYGS